MRVDLKDHVILRPNGRKAVLARIIKTGPLRAVLADKSQSRADTTTTFDLNESDIIANLGPKPKFGSAYNVSVEPWLQQHRIPNYADVLFYRRLKDDSRERVLRFLTTFGSAIAKAGLKSSKDYEITIREPKGKWMGFYHHHFDPKKIDELCARPEAFGNNADLKYLFAHEHGHALWYNNMSAAFRAEWVKEFNRATALKRVTAEQLADLRKGALQGPTLRDHFKALDTDDKLIMREIYKYLHRIYDLDKHDLQDLIEDNGDLADIWPSKIELSNKEEIVSKYAMTNPKELWADSFAFYWEGKDLPKRVSRLMDRTVKAIKAGNGGKAVTELEDEDETDDKPVKSKKKLKAKPTKKKLKRAA